MVLSMLKMFRNFFKDLLPYALNCRKEICQETWIFAKFVKPPTIKPNYPSFMKFAMHIQLESRILECCSLRTTSHDRACSGQVSADIHTSWNLCLRTRGSSKKFIPLEQPVKSVFVPRLQEKLERGANEDANYLIQIQS